MSLQAAETMRAFLRCIARQLAAAQECGDPLAAKGRELYEFFLREIKLIVSKAHSRSSNDTAHTGGMARAVRLLGEFAAPMAVYEGVSQLQQQLFD
eukprot:2335041-Prymnesium_polylepis.1